MIFFLVYLVQLWVYLCGVAREEWGGCEWMALAWNGDVPLVGATGAIIRCHAVETSVFFFAPYIPTTYPYHLSFSARLSLEEKEPHFPSPSPLFEEMFAEM